MAKAECKNCMFFFALPTSDLQGECRHSAPRLKFGRDGNEDSAAWPPVVNTDYCGDYEPDRQMVLDPL